ncbi:MAG: hypothetical protein KF726_21155 [Anaerolineae bacterium]|nr:hypothetical protein [Anaerolineae bacterium]
MPLSERDQLEQIFALIRAQKIEEARARLGAVLKANPNSTDGLYLATYIVSSNEQKIKLCERILAIDPTHSSAKMLLKELRPDPQESGFDLDAFVDDLPVSGDPTHTMTSKPVAEAFKDDLPLTPRSTRNIERVDPRSVLILVVVVALIGLLLVASTLLRQTGSQVQPTTVLLVVSLTPRPTDTASPTYTPSMTYTPRPTFTPLPSSTPYQWWLTLTAVAQTRRAPKTAVAVVPAATNTPNAAPTRVPIPTETPLGLPPTVTPPFMAVEVLPGQASMLDFRVIDAEYSETLDRIVAISSEPNAVHIFDPETLRDQAIGLDRAALCIGISPDGSRAAVGHDAQVTIIDLQTASLVNTFSISTTASDVVLTNDGWVYVMPAVDQWVNLHALNTTTGEEITVQNGLVRAGGVIKLHPDGNRMYYLERGISPAHMHRYDVSDRANPHETRDWSYHGDYYPCGAMWISGDGNRIFGGCANAFRLSTDDDLELTYNGTLEKTQMLSALTHSTQYGLLLGIVGLYDIQAKSTTEIFSSYFGSPNPTNLLAVYNYDSLTRVGVYRLPNLPGDKRGATSFGYYVFSNAAGTRFYVIAQADLESGLVDDFGIIRGDIPISGGQS